MSIKSAKAFFETLLSDEVLARKFKSYTVISDRLNMAKEMGYEFTMAQAEQCVRQMATSGELDEKALENVAGGATCRGLFGCEN